MRAVIAWSYRTLPRPLQRGFALQGAAEPPSAMAVVVRLRQEAVCAAVLTAEREFAWAVLVVHEFVRHELQVVL